jgi:hypothetical protein
LWWFKSSHETSSVFSGSNFSGSSEKENFQYLALVFFVYTSRQDLRFKMTDDAYMPSKLVSTSIAAKALGVSGNTLRTGANNKLIDFQLTPDGQRRFDTTTLRQAIEPADRRQIEPSFCRMW